MVDIITLVVIYLALVQSVFSYCVSVWGCKYSTHINVKSTTIHLLIEMYYTLKSKIVSYYFNLLRV